MTNKPDEIALKQWETLLRYWDRRSTQDNVNLNRECRGHPMAVPRTGRTSFPCIRHEMMKDNAPTDRAALWRITRQKKDGSYDENDGAKDFEEQLTTRLSQLPQDKAQDPSQVDQIFVDVIGSDGHGRVRSMGVGLSPSMLRTSTLQGPHSELLELRSEVARLKQHMVKQDQMVKQKLDDQRQQIVAEMLSMFQNGGLSIADGQIRLSEDHIQMQFAVPAA